MTGRFVRFAAAGIVVFIMPSSSFGQGRCIDRLWEYYKQKKYESALKVADVCIKDSSGKAFKEQEVLERSKEALPPTGVVDPAESKRILDRQALNDVSTAYFIKGMCAEELMSKSKFGRGRFRQIACKSYGSATKLPYGRSQESIKEKEIVFWSPAEESLKHARALSCTSDESSGQASSSVDKESEEDLSLSEEIQASVTRAMARWQRENEIDLTVDAEQLILEEFADESKRLGEVLNRQSNREMVSDAIVENYLFDVRDEKIRQSKSQNSNDSAAPRFEALSFMHEASVDTSIKSADIEHTSPFDFIESHLLSWKDRPLAILHVISKPDGATIEINGGYMGYTCKQFVLSEGRYHVHISPNCEKDVDAFANRPPAVASCQRLSTCSKWKTDSP